MTPACSWRVLIVGFEPANDRQSREVQQNWPERISLETGHGRSGPRDETKEAGRRLYEELA